MNTRINYLFYIVVVFNILWGAHAWFTWFLDDPEYKPFKLLWYCLSFCICLQYKRSNAIALSYDTNVFLGVGFLFFGFVSLVHPISLTALPSLICKVYCICVLLSDKRNSRHILDVVVKTITYILVPGIILHLYILIKGIFPAYPIQHPSSELYLFFNYGFLLKGALYYEADGLRFQSVFLEPAYLGTLIAYLLYCVKFDFKQKPTYILIIGLILSLSLAGYVLSFIGYIISIWSGGKSIVKYIVFGCCVSLFYSGVENYNDGNNIINEKILSRLETDEEKGIAGNNRTGEAGDYWFEQSLKDGSILTGLGAETIAKINGGGNWRDNADYTTQIRGTGYKVFLLYNGLWRLFLFVMGYYLIAKSIIKNRKYSYGFLVLLFVTFLQASYPQSYSWILPFILGINSNEVEENKI